MKTLLLSIVSCIVAATTFAQIADTTAFNNAVNLYEEEKYAESMDAFEAFLKDYPHSTLKPRAHLNLGYLYFNSHQLTESARVFKAILDEDYNETEDNNIMEPYMLYKHNSALMLAEISLQVKEWDNAEQYIKLFDEVYPYQHFCGNEWAAYHIMKATMDARLHEGQGKIDAAVRDLIPHIFFEGLASNEEAVELLTTIIRRNYSKAEIEKEVNGALASVERKTSRKKGEWVMTFFGVKVPIVLRYSMRSAPKTKEEYQEELRNINLFVAILR